MSVDRRLLLMESLVLAGTPYLWGAKGDLILLPNETWGFTPKNPETGRGFALDCSGGVTVALRNAGGPDLRKSHNTDSLWSDLAPVSVPQPGDLAFYAAEGADPDDMEHVMMVVAVVDGSYVVAGPSGGGRKTVSYEIASTKRACYKFRPSHDYRPGFRGFRSISRFLG